MGHIHKRRADRRCENDIAIPLSLENPGSSLSSIESTIEVDFHDIPPLIRCIVLTGNARANSRVGNNDVQSSEVCCNPLDRRFYIWLATDVGLVCCCFDIILVSDFCGSFFGVRGGFVDESDLVVTKYVCLSN